MCLPRFLWLVNLVSGRLSERSQTVCNPYAVHAMDRVHPRASAVSSPSKASQTVKTRPSIGLQADRHHTTGTSGN